MLSPQQMKAMHASQMKQLIGSASQDEEAEEAAAAFGGGRVVDSTDDIQVS